MTGRRTPPRGARRLVPVAVVTAVAVSGCGTVESGGGPGTPDLAGRTFESSGAEGRELVPGSQVRLVFSADRVSANAGCNTLIGGATWGDGVLAVEDPVATTLMVCADALMDQDDWLLAFLDSGPSLALEGSTLTLAYGSDRLVLDEL